MAAGAGAPMVIAGAVLSTVKETLVPDADAVLPAVSLAVLAAMDMPRVPSPVILEIRTVRVLFVPVAITVTVPLAVADLFNVTLLADRVHALKFVSA